MLKDDIHCPRCIHWVQQLSLIIIADKRGCLLVIHFQAHLNRIAAIIAPLHERFSASIAYLIHLGWRKVYMECRLALWATSAPAQSPHHILTWNLEIHNQVQRDSFGGQYRSQCFCLWNSSRKSIQNETVRTTGIS
jgi:hypothetical protein